jgi:hypothetical protein
MKFLHSQDDRLDSADQSAILDAIQADLENVQMAWQWAAAHGDEESLLMGLHGLSLFYRRRARFQEAVQLFAQTIAQQRARPETPRARRLLGRLLVDQGKCLHGLGRYGEAEAHQEEGRCLLQQHETDVKAMELDIRLAERADPFAMGMAVMA